MAQETRNAYGEKLAELVQKNENVPNVCMPILLPHVLLVSV